MKDGHVHFLHSTTGEYNFDLLNRIVDTAKKSNIEEIYLLEHTHQFSEFEKVYAPIDRHNEYQHNWLKKRMGGSIDKYLAFIDLAKKKEYDVKIKFGLEVCYIPKTENILDGILKEYVFDFLIGSVHYVDDWGFDHRSEFWDEKTTNHIYRRYYEIMEELIQTGIFTGLAHPDSIKCFNFHPTYDLLETYMRLAELLNKKDMYAEQSGGLTLNYGYFELGLNPLMRSVLKEKNVKMITASDAHSPEHVGMNIMELQRLLEVDR